MIAFFGEQRRTLRRPSWLAILCAGAACGRASTSPLRNSGVAQSVGDLARRVDVLPAPLRPKKRQEFPALVGR